MSMFVHTHSLIIYKHLKKDMLNYTHEEKQVLTFQPCDVLHRENSFFSNFVINCVTRQDAARKPIDLNEL